MFADLEFDMTNNESDHAKALADESQSSYLYLKFCWVWI